MDAKNKQSNKTPKAEATKSSLKLKTESLEQKVAPRKYGVFGGSSRGGGRDVGRGGR